MTKFELYLESGEKASLEDVCNWCIANKRLSKNTLMEVKQ